MSNWRTLLSDLDYGDEEAAAVQRVVASKWLSMGPEVQAFEQEFAAMQSTKFAVGVSSATTGLHLALLAVGVKPGDEVIQPALNFVAAANMTLAAGAKPVFADICSLSEPTIDPNEVERLITPRTKAVIVMHYGGNICRMRELAGLCRERGIALIEDACHAVGAAYQDPEGGDLDGKMAGSIGDIGVFSFFANKNLATGEGGMVVTDRDALADRLRLLRSHGMTSLTWDRHRGHAGSYDVLVPGYNYRLDELHAALGRAQLKKLARNNERRRERLALYREKLSHLDGWTMPFAAKLHESSGHLMVAVAASVTQREAAVQALRDNLIQSSLHYPCICDFEAFREGTSGAVTVSRAFTSRAITLPLYPNLAPEQIDEVVTVLARSV